MADATRAVPLQRFLKYSDIVLAGAVVLVIVMMIIPLPTPLLDILLALNITVSLTVLLVALYTVEPLDFSVFPSLLLVTTLFRLALNVSSTRLILLRGYAGQIIESFGTFVVGGNYIVGMVIFLILVVIQFVVITNGAGRVAEVAARFTLDAMPGKQMSIDADLNAGLISDEEARRRRRLIEKEADFYGAMDGASKFVKGDAIAGIIITLINLLGGIAVGSFMLGLSLQESAQRFALLTVGDGLVSQIPALLISTATGIVVTRAASESNLGEDLTRQILAQPRGLGIASGVLFVFGLVPGLPTVPFFVLSVLAGSAAYAVSRATKTEEERRKAVDAARRQQAATQESVKPGDLVDTLAVEPLEVEIGYGLIPLVDRSQGGDLLDRITMVRRRIATELGLLVAPIRIRDNLELGPNEYVVKIRGNTIARAEIFPDRYLAMDSGMVTETVEGIETREPAFGLPAVWVSEADRDRAELAGYTVVDPSSVTTTHLAEVIKRYAPELLGRQDVKSIIDSLKESAPAVVDEVIPDVLTIGEVQKVLQNLLRERVPIRDMITILEALGDYGKATRNVDILSEYCRQALARTICRQYQNEEGMISVITINPSLEQIIADLVEDSDQGSYLAIDPSLVQKIFDSLSQQIEKSSMYGAQPVVLTTAPVRLHLKRLTERSIPGLVVLSYNEIVPDVKVRSVGVVSVPDEA
jgi:flagellar biosynthesis protein FlhA